MSRSAPDASTRPARTAGRRFSVLACVGTSFTTWARGAPAFAVVSIVYQAPVIAALKLAGAGSAPSQLRSLALGTGSVLLSLLSWNLSLGAVTFGVLEGLRGRRAPIGRCLGVAFRTLPRLFGISFRMALHLLLGGGLAVFVAAIVASLVPFGRARGESAFASPGRLWLMGALLGVALLEYLARFATSAPIAVVEGADHWDSMERSRRLSFGRRWVVGTTLFLVAAAPVGLSVWLAFYAHPSVEASRDTDVWTWIATAFDVLVVGPLVGVAVATIYHDLRREREGVGADDLAGVFD